MTDVMLHAHIISSRWYWKFSFVIFSHSAPPALPHLSLQTRKSDIYLSFFSPASKEALPGGCNMLEGDVVPGVPFNWQELVVN